MGKKLSAREEILARLLKHVGELQTLEKRTSETTWQVAQDMRDLRQTFPDTSEGLSDFLALVREETGYDESSAIGMVYAVEVRETLAGTAAGEASADWPLHVMRAVFPSTAYVTERIPDKRVQAKIAREVNKRGAARDEKAARAVRREILGESPRGGRKSTAAKVEKLAEKIRERVSELLANGHDPLDLATGARLAEEYGAGTADAVLAIATALKEQEPTPEVASA